MIQKYRDTSIKVLRFGITVLLIVAPFYAIVVVWLSTFLHHIDLLRIWDEIALTILALIILVLVFDYQRTFKDVHRHPMLWLAGAYFIFMFVHGIWDIFYKSISNDAVYYGMISDIKPIAIFLIVLMIFSLSSRRKLPKFPWQKLIFIPAFIVIAFGLLQMTVLPKDFLRHFGYSASTVVPYQTVDNQPDIVRIQSTTRGPNPLGAYLLVVIVLMFEALVNTKPAKRLYWGAAIVAALIVLFGTYSRSAEIGLIISLLVLLLIHYREFLRSKIVPLSLVLVAAVGLLIVFRDSYLVQNTLLHTSKRSQSPISSNAERTQAIKAGWHDVVHEPWGRGIGSAGPASLRNKQGTPRIAENFFIQLGQEVGWLGIILFAAVNVRIAQLLWHDRRVMLSRVLLASLVGITFINMVSHAWTDDTLAYVWWTLAGLSVAPIIIKDTQKRTAKAA